MPKQPRNVRNFWLEIEIDGRKTPIACGPARKRGGFKLLIRQRNKGRIINALRIAGTVEEYANETWLELRVITGEGFFRHACSTER